MVSATASNIVHPSEVPYPIYSPRPRSKRRVSKLAIILFFLLLAFNTINLGTLYTFTTAKIGDQLAINPITFVVLAIPVFLLTKNPRGHVTYFRVAWLYWLAFTVGGFAGPDQITMSYPYGVAQSVFKLWISIIGVPWLAYRTIDEASLPKCAKVTYVLIAGGAATAVVQLLFPNMLATITTGGGRGAGVWVNPNLGATMCACGVLLGLMFPFRILVVDVALRAVMVCGLASTLSRAGILACLAGLVVYGLMLGRWTAILKTIVATLLLGILAFFSLEPLKQSRIPGLAARAKGIQKMLGGEVHGQTLQGRWYLWSQGFEHASRRWLRGRGHGAMNYAIKLAYLPNEGRWHRAGPHNYYIFVWGNSGAIGLIGLFIFFGSLASIGLKSQSRRIRAGLLGLLTVFALLACADHALFAFQFFGAIFAVFALAGHYTRKRKPQRVPGTASGQVGFATA